MTEAQVIQAMRGHLEGLFPKECPNCQRIFATLREYLQQTTHKGSPIPYDADFGDWQPLQPIGTMTLANCACGTTLALTSKGMSLPQLWRLLHWARIETKRRGLTPQELLGYLRDKICEQVLGETRANSDR
jgi:hypothetical protein